MIAVVSQAWTLDAEEHADAYIAKSDAFTPFLETHPGFAGRRLLRGVEDRTHFTNLRFFKHLADYEELIHWDGYKERIMSLGEHLKPYDSYPREFMEVVLGGDVVPASLGDNF
jgi:heme-degrading monooxygenase HmoA